MWREEINRPPLCVSPDYEDMLNIILVQVDESEATKLREFFRLLPHTCRLSLAGTVALFCGCSHGNHEAAEPAEAAAETGGFRPP